MNDSNFLYSWLMCLMFLTILSCQPKPGNSQTVTNPIQKEITVYGSHTCDHCIKFKAQLDSVGLKYVFLDVDNDKANTQELIDLINAINYKDYVHFPVVKVGEEVFIKPNIGEVVQEAR